jgi:hypothetical protein
MALASLLLPNQVILPVCGGINGQHEGHDDTASAGGKLDLSAPLHLYHPTTLDPHFQ